MFHRCRKIDGLSTTLNSRRYHNVWFEKDKQKVKNEVHILLYLMLFFFIIYACIYANIYIY